MLSFHLCLSCLRILGMVTCKMIFTRPDEREARLCYLMRSNYLLDLSMNLFMFGVWNAENVPVPSLLCCQNSSLEFCHTGRLSIRWILEQRQMFLSPQMSLSYSICCLCYPWAFIWHDGTKEPEGFPCFQSCLSLISELTPWALVQYKQPLSRGKLLMHL